MRRVITLTTDFGLDDPFVGIMKGVILSIAPDAEVVDITHGIRPQDVAQAAYAIKSAYAYFPKKTVHVAVVDPGVGGARRPMAAEYDGRRFVGPDNGIFSGILGPRARAYELARPKYFLKTVSGAFHGRDIFAPVAAWIARGTALSKLGPRITDPRVLDLPKPSFDGNQLKGQIVYIDRFGNLVSNIDSDWMDRCFSGPGNLTVMAGKKKIGPILTSYSQARRGQCGGIVNSWGHLEIFCREDSAAKCLGYGISETVAVSRERAKP
ncbi:MAG: SAM-dependent chlorinase/fluorinase [Nitrospinae bacterium]|nr:SAM-dependent chlorinase/fluorinase [Nitrospinota bacterium]